MRVLHTSDWHVGKTIQGRSREDEHRAVLRAIAQVARDEKVDLVLVAGDVFDVSAPSPASEEVVYEALLELTRDGTRVVVVSGNHDNGRRFTAVRPFLQLAGVHALGELARPEDGGCIELETRSGERARIALLPWLSQRGIVRASELMELEAAEQQQRYQQYARAILERLCGGFGRDAVNLAVAHLTVTGAAVGGGERTSETIFDYWVPPQFLPPTAQYCALGHIHRQQQLPVSWPVWYSGAPLELDFGEARSEHGVIVLDVAPGHTVADIRPVPLDAGRPLITVKGTLEAVRARAAAGTIDPRAHVRVLLDEAPRPGLAEDVYAAIPNTVKVQIIRPEQAAADTASRGVAAGHSPRELYGQYLEHAGVKETGPLLDLFDELHAEVMHATAEA
jgi:exonuclease SbcD